MSHEQSVQFGPPAQEMAGSMQNLEKTHFTSADQIGAQTSARLQELLAAEESDDLDYNGRLELKALREEPTVSESQTQLAA